LLVFLPFELPRQGSELKLCQPGLEDGCNLRNLLNVSYLSMKRWHHIRVVRAYYAFHTVSPSDTSRGEPAAMWCARVVTYYGTKGCASCSRPKPECKRQRHGVTSRASGGARGTFKRNVRPELKADRRQRDSGSLPFPSPPGGGGARWNGLRQREKAQPVGCAFCG
jgi:hypothetical protein